MKLIRIYNSTFTRLVSLTEQDFTDLTYRRASGEIGDCSFTVKLSRGRMSEVNLRSYNRIQIYEDGVVKFVGIITQKQIKLDTAQIKCRELSYILKKRLVGENYTLSGTLADAVSQLFNDLNAVEDTGIALGSIVGSETVNLTFNNADAWTVLKQLCDATEKQFEVTTARTIKVADQLGTDLTGTVLFRYNVNQVANANLQAFDIEDDGDSMVTRVKGKSGALTSTQQDAGLQATYGRLEKFKDFRVINTQDVLDEFTAAEITDHTYSPRLVLKPSVSDNFEINDLVKIKLKNPLVDINSDFQVLEKRVKYSGDQKLIEIRINDLPNYLVQKLADRDKRLALLEQEV